MTTKQPEALRLADALEGNAKTTWTREEVADELRRLHADVERKDQFAEQLGRELVAECRISANEKLRADQLAIQHSMQSKMRSEDGETILALKAENSTLQAGYDAARLEIASLRARSTAPAVEYPALSEPDLVSKQCDSTMRYTTLRSLSEDKLCAFADATCAMRAAQPVAPDVSGYVSEWSGGLCTSDEAMDGIAKVYAAQPAGAQQPGTGYAALPPDVTAAPAAAAGCTRSHPHENMDSACRAKAAIAEMQNIAAHGAEATAHDLERFVAMLAAAPTTQPAK